MAAVASLIPELEDAIHRGTHEQRIRTLERIASLFVQGAPSFSDEHVALFDDVLSLLIVEIETQALAVLSRRLAPIGNAPARTVQRLARNDEIAVAAPVLRQSRRLGEDDLIEIAQTKGQAHLLAVSERAAVPERVSDVLIRRGDNEVLRSVAANAGAQVSAEAYAVLVDRAHQDGALAQTVAARADIPPHLFRALIVQATGLVQEKLLASAKPEKQGLIRDILSKVASELGRQTPQRDFTTAQRAVEALHQAGKLGEAELIGFAKAGRFEETVATLSVLCRVPIDVVDRLMAGDRPDPVLIMCKAIGFDWGTVRPIILVRPEGQRMSAKALEAALNNFDRLSPSTAERVLRFWQSRQSHAPAEPR